MRDRRLKKSSRFRRSRSRKNKNRNRNRNRNKKSRRVRFQLTGGADGDGNGDGGEPISTSGTTIVKIVMEGCGPCQRLKDLWPTIKENVKAVPGGEQVTFNDDLSSAKYTDELLKLQSNYGDTTKFNVNEFPTIVKCKNKVCSIYIGDFTSKSIENWILK